jgi:hypothetical protein
MARHWQLIEFHEQSRLQNKKSAPSNDRFQPTAGAHLEEMIIPKLPVGPW